MHWALSLTLIRLLYFMFLLMTSPCLLGCRGDVSLTALQLTPMYYGVRVPTPASSIVAFLSSGGGSGPPLSLRRRFVPALFRSNPVKASAPPAGRTALGTAFKSRVARASNSLTTHTGSARLIVRGGPVEGSTPAELYNHYSGNFLVASVNCTSLGSQITYQTGMNAFTGFCLMTNIDCSLRTAPPWFDPISAPYSHQVTTLGAFMCFLTWERGLAPDTVSNYLAGVKNGFRLEHWERDSFSHPVLSQLKKSITLDWRDQEVNNLVHLKKSLPATVEMLVVLRDTIIDMQNLKDHAGYTACVMGLAMLTRRSESTQTIANHFIRAMDVTFHLTDPATGTSLDVKAHDAHRYDASWVTGVTTYFRSMKNDQLGRGGISTFSTATRGESVAYCVASDMFSWAARAEPLAEDPFLSHCGSEVALAWALTGDYFNKLTKLAAETCGLDPKRFSTHSWRIGGASILAAAGHPNHYIQHAGRWRSLAFLDYINWAVSSMKEALVSLVDPGIFTTAQMMRLNPGAALEAG